MENKHKQFKPYDKVLVRGSVVSTWDIELYSHYNKEKKRHETMCHYCDDDCNILPYEGNEHLVGTTDEPEEEIKLEVGDFCFPLNNKDELLYGLFAAPFKGVSEDYFLFQETQLKPMPYEYCIRFSDFNPNDMQETVKHILCVKDGKVVRYEE